MKKLTTLLAFAIHLSLSFPVQGDALVFPLSTEIQIGRIKNLIDRAPKGIYLTVGGERAFRGASMAEQLDHLIIFDLSPVIIRFNKINMELLKAPHKEKYKHLRWEADFSEWQKVSPALTQDDFKWWCETIRVSKGYDLPESLNRYGDGNGYVKVREKLMGYFPKLSKKFHNYKKAFLNQVTWSDLQGVEVDLKDPLTKKEFDWFDKERKLADSCVMKFIDHPEKAIDWGQVIDYKSGNYLFDDKLYQRLHKMVMENKITVIQLDLSSEGDTDQLASTIKNLGFPLAILDLDNLYHYNYMGEELYRKALTKLLEMGQKDSILIAMNNYIDFPCAQFSIYVGFTFENVRHWPQDAFLDALFSGIPSDVLPLMDGRLYEGGDELPLYLIKKE